MGDRVAKAHLSQAEGGENTIFRKRERHSKLHSRPRIHVRNDIITSCFCEHSHDPDTASAELITMLAITLQQCHQLLLWAFPQLTIQGGRFSKPTLESKTLYSHRLL